MINYFCFHKSYSLLSHKRKLSNKFLKEDQIVWISLKRFFQADKKKKKLEKLVQLKAVHSYPHS